MKKVKLLQITHDLSIGGLQQVVLNICKYIDRSIFDVSILCLRSTGEYAHDLEEMGINIACLDRSGTAKDYFNFLKIRKFLLAGEFNIIHTHNTEPFIDGTLSALISNVKTLIHTDHARNFPDHKHYMFAEWVMSHFAYRVVGVSEHTAYNLIRYESINPSKVVVIKNGIDCEKYSPKVDSGNLRDSLDIDGNFPILGLCVRLSKQKGIVYLLRALPEVIKIFPKTRLVIVGSGREEKFLKNLSHEIGVDKNVIFLGARTDIPQLIKLFDIYVLPSLWEGLPMVVLESMATGCPIIATDVGGNGSVIQHNINGSLIPPKKPAAISNEIIRLSSDPSLRRRYMDNGLDTVHKDYCAQIMTRKYESLYLRKCNDGNCSVL